VTPIILAFQSMSINQSISRTSRLCINQMHTQNRRFQFNKDQFSRPFTLTWLQFNVNCPKCRGKTGWISFSWANYFPSFPPLEPPPPHSVNIINLSVSPAIWQRLRHLQLFIISGFSPG